ncbi:glycerophosphodiester phosphodiesterase family protein [Paracoccus alkanivorans]|uniref:Glycerophosphodiester phosphodiesterase n=1 Tax=Paracoccus alkanivorans TaxID=2116655 RepID=A0A3M0M9R1_9RHOB|nr:glycerophosphodiester phosphodiesterase family protein [Paracoccus alkanivorans]RMC34389.1 glycerophosphodiester phosphodiesterase [Paracoccus alkanivorans]
MTRIMAHRGARNLWAENSLFGFRETLKHGFDAVEFDVHLTDAGELVVIHDATLERTTDGHGPVRALTPEARRALRLKGPDGELIDECPPTLDEVLALLATDPVIEVWVELKSDVEDRPYTGLAEQAADAILKAGLTHRAALHSFDIDVVREVRNIAPEMRRLISVNHGWAARHGGIAALLREAEGLVDIVGIHHELFEAELDVIRALRPFSGCSVWTINTPELMRRWIDLGPGFLVSDDPVLLKSLMHQSAGAA